MWKRVEYIRNNGSARQLIFLHVVNNYITNISNMVACKEDKNKIGIYCIKNLLDNKVYIGKSANIYRRIVQHLYDLRQQRVKSENQHFLNAWKKHGEDNFQYCVLEECNLKDINEKELFWMDHFKSNNRDFGYNLRRDSSTAMIVHQETRDKQSINLKQQWSAGIRDSHSQKLTDNWKDNESRKQNQSNLLTKTLTRYTYTLYNRDGILQAVGLNYQDLKKLDLQGVNTIFHRQKIDKVKHKSYIIERFS